MDIELSNQNIDFIDPHLVEQSVTQSRAALQSLYMLIFCNMGLDRPGTATAVVCTRA